VTVAGDVDQCRGVVRDLQPEHMPHCGGLLVVLDGQVNRAIAAEHGLGRCIFPKKNRIVFLAPDAQHLVTGVLAEAGDNVRMSLDGFFHRLAPTPAPR
jgi:Rps23 Pro-64 3,4-dihydroxylase Tpa1-like proline 4-hydroxylase